MGIFNGATEPNLIVHVARVVSIPVRSAPDGIVLVQPFVVAPPERIGFVCPDPAVEGYFGPKIFAGTPFENAPVLESQITISEKFETPTSTVEVSAKAVVCKLLGLGDLGSIKREPGGMTPFA